MQQILQQIQLFITLKRVSYGLVREQGRPREVVVILRPPNVIGFRAKGCKREYQLTTETCYVMACRAYVLAEKKHKAKERAERRKTKR